MSAKPAGELIGKLRLCSRLSGSACLGGPIPRGGAGLRQICLVPDQRKSSGSSMIHVQEIGAHHPSGRFSTAHAIRRAADGRLSSRPCAAPCWPRSPLAATPVADSTTEAKNVALLH